MSKLPYKSVKRRLPIDNINSGSGLISGTIANSASVTTPYNVTVTATDGIDPTSTTFAWNVSGFTLDNPGDQSNAEGDAVVVQPSVETNGNPTLTFSASGLPNGLSINPNTGLVAGTLANLDSNSSPYTVTISATDGTSTSSQTFTWTVTHVLITDPGDQINAPGDVVSLPIPASDPDNDTLTYTASGLPQGLSISATTGLISGTIDATAGSDTPYSVTVTASDGTHTATDTFNWTVANQAVTVTNPGTQNNAEGDSVSLPISASDPAGNPLSYSASGLPLGLQIDYASGIISGTLDSSAAETNGGVYEVTVLADDGQGNNGSVTFTWNVSHVNQAPTLDNPGDQLNQAGDVVSLSLFGSDADGDTVSYTATGLPPGVSINSTTGIISGTLPASAGSGTPYSVTVTVSDGTLNASQTFNWTVTAGPVTLTSPGDQSNSESDSVSLQLSATGDSGLTYSASGLPSGLSIDSGTGLISGTVASGDAANGPYTVTISTTDTQGNSSAKQFTWTINAANLDPLVSSPGLQINTQGDVLALPITATDPAGNGLTYSVTGLPPGLSIDAGSGLISGVLSGNSAAGSPYSVTVTATDGSNQGSVTFTWSVTNQAVTVTNPGTQSNTGGDAVSLQISANDPAQLPLTYAAAGLPEGLSIDAGTGLISGTLDSSAGGAYTVTVMASDSQGNSGSASFTWNVSYVNQTPTLDNPSDQLDNAGDVVSLQLSGYDVDGDSVTYSAAGLPPGLSVDPSSGIISGTLSASAGSGTPYSVTVTASDGTLTASQTFNWTVTASPVTLTSPGDQSNGEGDSVSLPLSATGGSGLTYGASGLPSGLSIASSTGLISGTVASGDSANGPYTVTITATDTQGHSAAQQFTWNINAPASVLTLTNPGNQSNAEGDDVSLPMQVSGADDNWLSYAASGLPIGLFIDPMTGLIQGTIDYSAAEIAGGQYQVTVTVNDGNGQTASQSFVWAIADTPQAPWLEYPEFQDSQDGMAASLQLVGGSPDGKTLTYSATGLPAGLSVNAATGLISGTITAAMGSYTVTATVSDGTQTASQTFTWKVTCEAAPQVILAINGTEDHSDDVGIVNPSLTIPLTITLQNAGPGLHLIQISIPSERSQVDQSQFYLANGASMTIQLTPLQESQLPDDVDIQASVDGSLAGDQVMTNVQVTYLGDTEAFLGGGAGDQVTPDVQVTSFPDNIRAKDTPDGMSDRIPPSRDGSIFPVEISLSQPLGPREQLVLTVLGNGSNNVFLGFDHARSHTISSNRMVGANYYDGIFSNTQTDPANARQPKLTLEYSNGTVIKQSDGFSIAAIPIAVRMSSPKIMRAEDISKRTDTDYQIAWGFKYQYSVISDTGDPRDLSAVTVSERLDPKVTPPEGIARPGDATGAVAFLLSNLVPSGFLRVGLGSQLDYHDAHYPYPKEVVNPRTGRTVPVPLAIAQQRTRQAALQLFSGNVPGFDANRQGPGTGNLFQYFEFTEARTGVTEADPLIVENSGFVVKWAVTRDGANYSLTITKRSLPNNGAAGGLIDPRDARPQPITI